MLCRLNLNLFYKLYKKSKQLMKKVFPIVMCSRFLTYWIMMYSREVRFKETFNLRLIPIQDLIDLDILRLDILRLNHSTFLLAFGNLGHVS